MYKSAKSTKRPIQYPLVESNPEPCTLSSERKYSVHKIKYSVHKIIQSANIFYKNRSKVVGQASRAHEQQT